MFYCARSVLFLLEKFYFHFLGVRLLGARDLYKPVYQDFIYKEMTEMIERNHSTIAIVVFKRKPKCFFQKIWRFLC